MRGPWTLAFALILWSPVAAADKDKPAAKPEPELIPGYKTRAIEGFKVHLNNTVLKENEASPLQRKPLEVLEHELKTIKRVFYPSTVAVLQRGLTVFVEWDEQDEANPNAIARYYGGSQLAMLKKGKNPLKANNVEIMRLKVIATMQQPGNKFQRCTLLHEFAHAVHHQVLKFDNQQIKEVYQLAMTRKLYDEVETITGRKTKAYAATNEHEYFAELSCSYLYRGDYFPFTREDLKKHDPEGYKLMQLVWGKPHELVVLEREKKQEAETAKTSPGATPDKPKPPVIVNDAEEMEKTAAKDLKLIQILIQDGKTERAKERLQELIKKYSDTQAAGEAKQLLEKLK